MFCLLDGFGLTPANWNHRCKDYANVAPTRLNFFRCLCLFYVPSLNNKYTHAQTPSCLIFSIRWKLTGPNQSFFKRNQILTKMHVSDLFFFCDLVYFYLFINELQIKTLMVIGFLHPLNEYTVGSVVLCCVFFQLHLSCLVTIAWYF